MKRRCLECDLLLPLSAIIGVCPECASRKVDKNWWRDHPEVLKELLSIREEELEREERTARRRNELREREEQDERDRRWKGICPLIFRQTNPERIPEDVLRKVMSWEMGPTGLLLVGPTKSYKTRLAWLLLKKQYNMGIRIEAFDSLAFGHECAKRFYQGGGEDWVHYLSEVPLVFFDDIGKCKFTERTESELFGLVDRRVSWGRPIIATTNMIGEQLAGALTKDRGEPLIRRLREFCTTIVTEL